MHTAAERLTVPGQLGYSRKPLQAKHGRHRAGVRFNRAEHRARPRHSGRLAGDEDTDVKPSLGSSDHGTHRMRPRVPTAGRRTASCDGGARPAALPALPQTLRCRRHLGLEDNRDEARSLGSRARSSVLDCWAMFGLPATELVEDDLEPFKFTHVVYQKGDMLGKVMALLSLAPM